jgi:glucokinase
MTTAQELVALDIGGTKIAAALVTFTGQILARTRMATPQDGPQDALPRIAAQIRELLAENGRSSATVQALGIGIPAVLEPDTDRVIWAPNISGWRDVALRESLQSALNIPTFVEYDGHAAVLGEWWAGAGRGCDSLVDIIIGTGIGGGMILDGRLLRGRDRLAGAAGWTALTTDAGQPASRQIGHWEALAAGPGIAARAAAARPDQPASTLAAADPLSAQAVFDAARGGDPLARRIVDETADLIGLGVANIVSAINPQRVILGGSVGAQGDLLLPRVRRVVSNWAQPISAAGVEIVSSTLATDAALLGAAYGALLRLAEEKQTDVISGRSKEILK